MTRTELLTKLKELAMEAELSNDTIAAAGVLYCVLASVECKNERELLNLLVNFSQMEIKRLAANRN